MKLHQSLFVMILLCICSNFTSSWFTNDVLTPVGETDKIDICDGNIFSSESDENTVVKCKCVIWSRTVDCSELELKKLPHKIFVPPRISVAVFQHNGLEDINDDTFYSGREVVELDFSFNELDFISTRAFVAFSNLQRLNLNHNRLWVLQPHVFDNLYNLRVLDLSFNSLKSLDPAMFQHLGELRELKLESNPLAVLEPKTFQYLKNLEVLDLESTLLQNVSDNLFVFTPKLKILGLGNNQLTTVPSVALKPLKNLKSLDLSGNHFEIIEPHAFFGMKYLVRLHLNRMPTLKTIQKHAFSGLEILQVLHCSYNYMLTDIDEKAFLSDIGNERIVIDELVLRQNNLENLSPNLISWTQATELHLEGNPWNCDCKSEWMLKLELKNKFQDGIGCASPSVMRGRMLSSIKEGELTCELSTGDIIFIMGLAIAAVIILLLIIGCFVYRRNTSQYEKPDFQMFNKSDFDETVYDRNFRP